MKSEEIENLILKHKLKPSGESKIMTEEEYKKIAASNVPLPKMKFPTTRPPIPELIDARDEIERLKKEIAIIKAAQETDLNLMWLAAKAETTYQVNRLTKENIKLRIAFHDAINRPKGVVPVSGETYYSQDIMHELKSSGEVK